MCQTSPDIRFARLGAPRRIWAVSAIHGEAGKLCALHDALLPKFRVGDRVVYLGNMTGYGMGSRDTVDELLTFRRLLLAHPGVQASDIVYLRGRQEDMWVRLMQVAFSTDPSRALADMLVAGLGATLASYDIDANDGMRASREGAVSLTRWIGKIRTALRAHPGHDLFVTLPRRAAYSERAGLRNLLFVPAGIDFDRSLDEQGEHLWAAGDKFHTLSSPFDGFARVIRGYDPARAGVRINCVTASLDGGAGFGGALVCAGFVASGDLDELLHA